MKAKILKLNSLDGVLVAFHSSRLFAVHSPFLDKDGNKLAEVAIALRTVEQNGIAFLGVQEKFTDVVEMWENSLCNQ